MIDMVVMVIKMTMMRKILENLSQTGEKDGVCHSGEAGLHHHERAGELGDGDHSYGDSDGDFDFDFYDGDYDIFGDKRPQLDRLLLTQ